MKLKAEFPEGLQGVDLSHPVKVALLAPEGSTVIGMANITKEGVGAMADIELDQRYADAAKLIKGGFHVGLNGIVRERIGNTITRFDITSVSILPNHE